MLDEQEHVLLWEGLQVDEPGVDCWVQNDRGRFAEQYKTKSNGTWSISDLTSSRKRTDGTNSSSVLAYARTQLQRTDAEAASEFHFISNTPAPDLNTAIAAARAVTDPLQWMIGDINLDDLREKIVRGFRLDPARPEDIALAHGLVRRMRIRTIDGQTLEEDNLIIARVIAPSAPERLLSILRTLARASLTHRVTALEVRSAAVGIDLVAPAGHLRSADHLADALAVFMDPVNAARGLTVIPRNAEADGAAREVLAADRARTVIVHGPAGVGKSEVLLQAIYKLRASGVPTLVMRADQAASPPLGPDPVRTLCRYAGGNRACLVIDQLDQVVLAGDRFQHLITPLTKWITLARAMNIAVLIGCRTIDVEQDTHLRRVLCPDDADRYRKILVEDLTHEQATVILTQAGIPIDTIHPELVPLVRRPLVLRLLTELVTHGGIYSPARTILDLVVAWWEEMRQPHGDLANDILDAFVQAVEQDGQLAVERLRLPHPTIVVQLVSTGVLIDSGNGCVRPFHQVLVDVWLAQKWNGVRSFADLILRIGPRADQTLHHARRLRLTIQLFASRGPHGARICDEILHSPEVRPILKRAMLLGIAVIDNPSQPWVALVTTWLADPHYSGIVRATVLYNHLTWMDTLSSWLVNAWTTYPPEQRPELIRLLAAVGESRGDLVATCLLAWLKHDPSVLQQAEFVFWHNPSKDSESLFELRLQHYADMQHHRDHGLTWDKLLEGNPVRAMRLLAYHINRANDEALQERSPDWFHSWPVTLPANVRETELRLWDLIRDRWARITISDPWCIRLGRGKLSSDRSVLTCLVDVLAVCLAHALQNGILTWSGLLTQLPVNPRLIDHWLLLRVGAACDSQRTPQNVLADAVHWFMGDVTLGQLAVGSQSDKSRFAEEFLLSVSAGLDRRIPGPTGQDTDSQHQLHLHAELERWLIGYPEQLVAAKGQLHGDFGRETQLAEQVAYRLLGRTDRQRWSAETVAFYDRLHGTFDDGTSAVESDYHSSVGWVRSDIGDDQAMTMSCEEWVTTLRSTSSVHTWAQSETEANMVLSGDLRTRLQQLRLVVQRNQDRFLAGIEVFLSAIPPLPLDVLGSVVDGIVTSLRPDRLPQEEVWTRIDDALVIALFMDPRIRNSASTVMSLTDAVRDRSAAAWPDEVIARLQEIARGETNAGLRHEDTTEITNYRLNECCCRAIDALARIAHNHEARRGDLLALAESLQGHPDVGRRASAGLLACHSYSADPERGFNVVLSVASDTEIAAEHDTADALFFLIRCPKATTVQKQAAITILTGLVRGNERQARRGGNAVLILRAWDQLTTEQMMSELAHSVVARTAAASTLAEALQDEKTPALWMRGVAFQFAEDESDEVGKSIFRIFNGSCEHLLEIPGFFPAMVRSRAASHAPEELLELFCRSADIVPMAPEVLHLISSILPDVEVTAENQWSIQRTLELGVNALHALVSQAEQMENAGVRSLALDAWDRLIERPELAAQNKLNTITDFTLG